MRTAFQMGTILAMIAILGFGLGCSEKKPSAPVTSNIKVSKRDTRQIHELDVINDAGIPFRECELTITVFRENGSKEDVKRYWDTWAPNEKKILGLPTAGRIERVDVEGTAQFPNANVPGRIVASFNFPNPPASSAKPTVDSFTSRRDEGRFSHDLIYKYTGAEKLQDVHLTLTVQFDRGAKPVIQRFYATWLPNEEKKVNVSASDGTVEKHELSGTAKRDGAEVMLTASFSKNTPGGK